MRHALRTAIRPCLSILLVACALSCGSRSVKTEFSPALVNAQGQPSLGHLEHRGEMYDLRAWSSTVHDANERNSTVALPFLRPTIADDGSGLYLMTTTTTTLPSVDLQFQMFGLEDLEEEQCVEITDVDGPIPADVRFVFPESP